MWQRNIDCLGLAVRVRTNAPEIIAPLAGVLRSYADASAPPDADYLLDAAPRLVRDDASLHGVELAIDLIAAFERDLYRRILALSHDVVLHAGATVDAAGRAIVVAGRSGAGKSTLMRGLLARGLRYLSEEYVAIRPGARCLGLARALHVDDPAISAPAGYTVDDYPLRPHPPGTFRLFHPPEHAIWRGEATTAAIVAIDHGPDAPDTLERITGGDALVALWPAMFQRTPEVLPQLEPALSSVPLYRLRTTSPAKALELVAELARG